MNRILEAGKKIWKVMLMVTIFWGLICGPGFAGDVAEIISINPVPDLQVNKPAVQDSPNMIINGRGFIGRIGQNEMVIGDMLFPILNATQYFRVDGTPAKYSEFSVGSYVGFRLNNAREIIELWNLVE